MRRLTTVALLMAVGLSTTGCGFINGLFNRGGDIETADQGDADEAEVVTEDDDTEAADTQEEDGELFKEAMLPGLPSAAEIALAELLPSTDPNERLKEIEQDRPDPYAYVPVPPPPAAAPPAPEDVPSPGAQGNNDDAQDNEGVPPAAGEPVPLQPLPALPEPTVVASQVQISGVAQVNGEIYAIVKAPGEPTSRYVKVGDLLSNGAVLVKRIETRPGNDPVVVLEERGVEIALPVGSGTGAPEEETAFQSPPAPPELAALPSLP
ncbi:MAG: hypothetical protein F6J95_016200 [Leptolyngbya sp. SIO1E4]|nr:hypothetical protein [Leptolyngbya sp. SIO1E4]